MELCFYEAYSESNKTVSFWCYHNSVTPSEGGLAQLLRTGPYIHINDNYGTEFLK